jgi:hypothetical protein
MRWRALLLLLAAALVVIMRRSRSADVPEPATPLPRGGRSGRIERCGIHGIAFDGDTEVCPVCAQETIARKA